MVVLKNDSTNIIPPKKILHMIEVYEFH